MPARKYHLQFDDMLADKGVICEDTYGDSVHGFVDRGAKKWGRFHREIDPKHDAGMIRPWIAAQVQRLRNFRQDTATDYVRIAWGHMVLDHVVSKIKNRIKDKTGRRPRDSEFDWDKVHRRAWRYYREAGFDRTCYRGANRRVLEKVAHWLFGRGDRARA